MNKYHMLRIIIAFIISIVFFYITNLITVFNCKIARILILNNESYVVFAMLLWFFYLTLYCIVIYVFWHIFAFPSQLHIIDILKKLREKL